MLTDSEKEILYSAKVQKHMRTLPKYYIPIGYDNKKFENEVLKPDEEGLFFSADKGVWYARLIKKKYL